MLRLPLTLPSMVLGVVLVVDLAYAQPGGAPPRGGHGHRMPPDRAVCPAPGMSRGMWGGGVGVLKLLPLEQVQKDLNLSGEQKEQLKRLAKEVLSEMPRRPADWQSLAPDQRKAKRKEMRKKAAGTRDKVWKQLADILKSEQLERLKQIHLQARGAAALNDPKVAKTLGITDQQRKKLKAIHKQIREQRDKVRGSLKSLSREERKAKAAEMRKKMRQIKKELMEKTLEVLTPQQREMFEKMKGRKIDLDFSALRPRRPHPQRPRPQRPVHESMD